MRKWFIALCAGLIVGTAMVKAETITIQPGDTLANLARRFNTSVQDLQEQNDIKNPNLIYAGDKLQIGSSLVGEDFIGVNTNANPLPSDNYDSFLSSPLSSNTSTVFVNALPTGVSTSIYTIFASDGTTPREKLYCEGTATSPNRLTLCRRGVSFSPVSGVINESAGTGLTHSKNARIAITDNINFSGKALAILSGYQNTSSTEFIMGTGASTTMKLIWQNTSATSSASWCGFSGGVIVCSEDGTNTFRLRDGGSGVSAGRGIQIDASILSVNTASTTGLGFNNAGQLTIATGTNNGIRANVDGIVLNTSSTINWQAPWTFSSGLTVASTSQFTASSSLNMFGDDTGSVTASNTYVAKMEPGPSALKYGAEYTFRALTTSTGASTLNINNLGAVNMRKGHRPLGYGDIVPGIVKVVYDGTNFQVISGSGGFQSYGFVAQFAGQATTTVLETINTETVMSLAAIIVPVSFDLTTFSIDVLTVNTGGRFHLALYSQDGRTLVAATTTAIGTTGAKTFAVSTSTIVTPGIYYFGMKALNDGSVSSVNVTSWKTDAGVFGRLNSISGRIPYAATLTTGANVLPTGFNTSSLSASNDRGVVVRLD